jgi:hypothetical protein
MTATRLAPRTVVRLDVTNHADHTGHLVSRAGYRTLCGETVSATTGGAVAITCHVCGAVAAELR